MLTSMTSPYQSLSFDQIQIAISERMKQANIHQLVIDDFLLKTEKVYQGETGQIDFSQILNLKSNDIFELTDLPQVSINDIQPLIEQTVIIKLNGGLGTSMGLNGPKTLLPVHNN
ncbi:MAG: UTP--glucose-1-phosphate uridylyltransferase, partial [Leptonema sp. (in: Bacteria)]|nr:UTP--glucose-1-phosphate uridylyltransferase [Leptonema sp. (in: bacteria)]